MKTKYNETLMEQAINYYQQGNSLVETAKVFPIGAQGLYYHMKKRGISLRNRKEGVRLFRQKTRKSPDIETIKRLYFDEKWSLRKIGETFGVAAASIRSRLLREKIKTRRPDDPFLKLKKAKGENHGMWKGGRIKNTAGYVLIHMPGHRRADNQGYVKEHILVWEDHNKKALPKGWVIHHINGIKDDNRIENLQAMTQGEHINLHRKINEIKKGKKND